MAKKKAAKKKPVKKAVKKIAKKSVPKKKAAPKKKTVSAKKPKAAPVQAPAPLPWRVPLPGETKIGVVEDYFGHVGVIAFTLEAPLAVGDKIHVHGHTTDLTLIVDSLQIEHQSVTQAGPKAAVGVKVADHCRAGDYVYKVKIT